MYKHPILTFKVIFNPAPRHGCEVALGGLFCIRASWPSVPVPATYRSTQRPVRGHPQGFQQPTSDNMAAIPSRGSLVATHNYHQPRPGATSSYRSGRDAEYPGEAILTILVSPTPPTCGLDTGGEAFFPPRICSPLHGYSLGGPRMLRISPGLQWRDHLASLPSAL